MILSTHTWMRPEPLEKTFERASSLGYGSIELAGEPDKYSVEETKELLGKYGLSCWGTVTLMYGNRDLVATERAYREETIQYIKKTIDLAQGLGGQIVTVVPSTVGKLQPGASPRQEWAWLLQGMREVALYAQSKGIRIVVEPLNRFETYLITNASQALRFIEELGMSNVGVAFDTFHASIEEPDVVGAIHRYGARVFDVHLGENNRLSPGDGSLNWPLIVQALRDVGYNGHLAHESMPPIDRSSHGDFGAKQLETEPWDVDEGTLQFLKDHASGVLRDDYYTGLLKQTAEIILPLIQ